MWAQPDPPNHPAGQKRCSTLWLGSCCPTLLRSRLRPPTFAPEDQAALASFPAHVFKTQQGDVNSQLGTALPNTADVAGANSGDQRDCREEEEMQAKKKRET